MVAPVVMAYIFKTLIYDANFGYLSDVLVRAGGGPFIMFEGTWKPILALLFMDVVLRMPFVVLILYAGISTLPTEQLEAAAVDGANLAQRIWSIVLPILRPIILVAFVFRFMDALKIFDEDLGHHRGWTRQDDRERLGLRFQDRIRAVQDGLRHGVLAHLRVHGRRAHGGHPARNPIPGGTVNTVPAPAPHRAKQRARARPASPRLKQAAKIGTLLMIVLITLVPFLLVLMTSLKTKVDSVALPPKWIFTPTLENYVEQLANEEFFRAALNSLVIASLTTVLATLIAVFSGYALARFQFRGQSVFAYSFLLIRAVPPIAFVIPYFMIWRDLGWRDTYQAMVVMYLTLALPLMVWMLRSFFVELPVEIEEAAMVDGCTRLGAMRHVLIPNVMPGIVAAAGLSFILVWNEFMYALFNTGTQTQTLPVQIYQSLGYFETNWAKLSSAAVVAVIPAVIFVGLTQRFIVRGLSMGAVKG